MQNVFLLAVLSAGCLTEMGSEEEMVVDDETSERVALNGLMTTTSTTGLTTNTSQLQALALGSLSSAASRVPTMFSTAAGRDQFSYLVSCAVTAGATVRIAANRTTYTFAGTMGLAKEWKDSPLLSTKYTLITACMAARTNYFGVQVPISMRGAKIPATAGEDLAFTVLEGAFWGDAFTTDGQIRACASPTKLSGAAISTLPQRECAVSLDGVTTTCGFSYAGDCSAICSTDTRMGYVNCETAADTIAVFLAKP